MAKKPGAALASRSKATNNAQKNVNTSYQSSGDTIIDDDATMSNGFGGITPGSSTPDSDAAFNIDVSSSGALASLSRESNKLLAVINELALLGLDKYSLELPKIVTIGDQSAGKSSAIAAISGITVPRKAGICTQCPSHINLTHSENDEWSCTVSLEKKYCFAQGTWNPLPRSILTPLARINSPAHLEHVLKLAQAAALNPGMDPLGFMTNRNIPVDNQTGLSPNLVQLDITGPQCPNLTFYDLPGVFNQTADKAQAHLVRQVRSLLKDYIDPETNIILLACAMENDLENSTAASLIENVRHRCIGLLTKADRLPEGYPTNSWGAVLNGDAFKLEHGYFVTKQPNQSELDRGMDHASAREAEELFFQTQYPWNSTFAEFKPRFGIPRLQEKLSEILVQQIRANVPRLRKTIDERLAYVDRRLHELPEPPGSQAFSLVSKIVSELKDRVEKHMTGEIPYNTFMRHWTRKTCPSFGETLYNMRPTLVPRTQREWEEKQQIKHAIDSATNPIELDDEDEDPPTLQTPSKNRKRQASSQIISPNKKSKSDNGFSPFGSFDRAANSTSIKSEIVSTDAIDVPLTSIAETPRMSFRLDDIHDHRLQMNTSAVAGTTDHRAEEDLELRSVRQWNDPLEVFIQTTIANLRGLVSELSADLLVPWQSTLLAKELPTLIDAFIDDLGAKHKEHAMHLLAAEQLQPATINEQALAIDRQRETSIIQDARHKWRAGLFLDKEEQSQKNGRLSQGTDREVKLQKIKPEHLGTDKYADEITTMGRVRGYYSVASASFADTMMKLQRLDLFEHTKLYLIETIVRRLKLHEAAGFQYCQELLEEDPKKAEERREFLAQRDKFQRAKAKLDTLMQQ